MTDRTPTGDLRERLEAALRAGRCCMGHIPRIADAVMHVIEAEILAVQVDATRRADELAARLQEAERQRDEALAAVQRVRELHVRNVPTGDCEHCSERDYPDYAVPWPCPTIAALDQPEGT